MPPKVIRKLRPAGSGKMNEFLMISISRQLDPVPNYTELHLGAGILPLPASGTPFESRNHGKDSFRFPLAPVEKGMVSP